MEDGQKRGIPCNSTRVTWHVGLRLTQFLMLDCYMIRDRPPTLLYIHFFVSFCT